MVTGTAASAAGARGQGVSLIAQAISVPAGFLVMAGMLTAMLPTNFGRACLVTLIYYLIVIVIVAIIAVIAALVFGLTMVGGR
jgi:hypothetical protein